MSAQARPDHVHKHVQVLGQNALLVAEAKEGLIRRKPPELAIGPFAPLIRLPVAGSRDMRVFSERLLDLARRSLHDCRTAVDLANYGGGTSLWAGDWHGALVCRRGHVLDSAVRPQEPVDVAQSCAECGAAVLVGCTNCGLRIRGVPGDPFAGWDSYKPPGFCDGCGTAHPWATRQQRIYELENILDQADIDDADRLFVHARLAELRAMDGSDQKNE